jgi:hypothetical protein
MTDAPDVETWETVVDDLEPATWAEVGYELAEREGLSPETALDLVDDALAGGVLEENTDSRPETLSVADDRTGPDDDGGGDPDADTNSADRDATTEADSAGGGDQVAEPPEPGENSGENPETRRTNPGVRAVGAGSPAADSADSAGRRRAPGVRYTAPGGPAPRRPRAVGARRRSGAPGGARRVRCRPPARRRRARAHVSVARRRPKRRRGGRPPAACRVFARRRCVWFYTRVSESI